MSEWERGQPMVVVDTSALLREVVYSCHGGGLITSLLWSLGRGRTLILPREVVEETIARLHRVAKPDILGLASWRLQRLYLARAVVVDVVPSEWAASDPRVVALAHRDTSDLPAARLAIALGAHLLSDDNDLRTPGLAAPEWLPVVHGFAAEADVKGVVLAGTIPTALAFEGVRSAGRAVARASATVQVLVLGGIAVLIIWLVTSGRGRQLYDQTTPALRNLADTLGPPLAQLAERHHAGQAAIRATLVLPSGVPTLGELIANVLASYGDHDHPMLAEDVARHLAGGNLRERTRAVRDHMRAWPATFPEVNYGRFTLGRPLPLTPAPLPPNEVADFVQRTHGIRQRPYCTVKPLTVFPPPDRPPGPSPA